MSRRSLVNTRPGRLRAFYEWVVRPRGSSRDTLADPPPSPARVGPYRIVRNLGQGGMGIVYAAVDERLQRTVALKTLNPLANDDTARRRFWREARAAASVNHPNVCQVYEVGEDEGEPFIAMEMLEGEALSARLARGALTVSQALPVALEILDALEALHARGIVHRDLKPSNVFLTPRCVKLLDFGVARASEPSGDTTDLTRTGVLLGTPRYMAPEQVTGAAVDARSDLFALGAILFEMLAARPAFGGRGAVEILHATLYEQPPALTGSPAIAAVDRVIRRALAKKPGERHASAQEMAADLRALVGTEGESLPALARALTRLVVLPFRVLRPDPETDFLAFSLADAITTSLTGIGSLVVRSSATAARFAGEPPDLAALGAQADVDRVLMGTLVRSGAALRATVQLVTAPEGTLVASHTVQASLGELFRMQDEIAQSLVRALAAPLGAIEDAPTMQAPEPRAYALYLQANELARRYDTLPAARELYQRSLELDPAFAPAWAQLGRCHRVIGKYVTPAPDCVERAQAALRRALERNPRLTLAHKHYANLEADTGQPRAAMVRLLGEAQRHGNDAELFAGLVHACRYCGLFDASIAADEEARRLDPNVATSVEQTVLMTGDVERLLSLERARGAPGSDEVIRVIGLGLAGRRDEARELLQQLREGTLLPLFRTYSDTLLAWLDRQPAQLVAGITAAGPFGILDDPEAIFQEGWLLCDLGDHARGLDLLGRAVEKGYAVAPTLSVAPAFAALRRDPAFRGLVAQAESERRLAAHAFRDAGGERLLGRQVDLA